MATLEHGDPSAPGLFGFEPAVIGHRGLGRGVVDGHRENTLGSFTSAVGLGMSWLEVDVRRTADDTLVVAHDPTYADGVRVADLSGAETDERGTLRLADLFAELPAHVGVDVDLKSSMDDGSRPSDRTTAGVLSPVVADEATRRPVVVSSFDPAALSWIRHEAPQVGLAWLTWHRFPLEMAVAGCAHLDIDALGLHVGSLGVDRATGQVDVPAVARMLSLVHGAGREVMVWCPELEPARMLVDAGVDAVVVDDVPQALGAFAMTA
ncbi:glycerophosphoryl diester phosphodiesterase [Modestobacter sp. DSM 44400]|uniref:glycerophosphodiester phosphodiesterase n=1 Tax=Modestobacter sp. DSM 44400 TaxID=1550230 RepID=UPI0008960432|nr:glycerophosphodiester phosphodiesterase [Modestobacter sp. DSM 44400]SDX91722.1 glycerophosphoryl diester phosphodiesterase [Modestobacter sp. DSM 44400]